MKSLLIKCFLALFLLSTPAFAADPLPSWNDTPQKAAIVSFVKKVTQKGSPAFVPPAERIATFDNDGTLMPEQPVYLFVAFTRDRIKALAPNHPEWKDKQPFKAVLEGDMKTVLAGGFPLWLQLDAETHAGKTTEEFTQIVKDWSATATHPETGRLYMKMAYQPMLEVLNYLRANSFKIFIVSGSWIDFIRPWAENVYGIPPENIIGSSLKTTYDIRDGKPVIDIQPEVNFINDIGGKPLGINHHIGRRPIAAFGNSDGDLQMFRWTAAGSGLRFVLMVHHTDKEREWAYDKPSSIGQLDKALDEAKTRGWTVVDMKNDWKTIYVPEKKK